MGKGVQCGQHAVLREQGIGGDPHQRFPALAQLDSRALDTLRLFHQHFGLAIEHLSGFGELGLAAFQAERAHAQLGFDLLHGITDGRLALVQGLGGVGVAALVDHGQQGLPLIQRDFG